jgi:hypothetical protein
MVGRMAKLGWRKSPCQTPADFVAAIQEPALRTKVEKFTRHYESARFGRSVDDAEILPRLYDEITARDRQTTKTVAPPWKSGPSGPRQAS